MSKLLIIILVPVFTYGSSGQFNYELNLLAGYGSGGYAYTAPDQRPGFGFEYFRVFSSEYADIAKMDIQVRLTADPNGRYETPYVLTPFYGNMDKQVPAIWLEIHNAYLLFKVNQGRSDIWLGHRDVRFGLEPSLDTHGPILQSLAMDAFGFKMDWGAGVTGRFEDWDYSVAGALGSGMPFSAHGNWSVAGRAGILDPGRSDISFGISGYYGKTLPAMELMVMPEEPVERFFGGTDVKATYGRYGFQAEGLYGRVGRRPAAGVWARATVEAPGVRWLIVSGQGSVFYDDLRAREATYRTGAEAAFKYNAALTFGGAYLFADDGDMKDHRFLFHAYYFYPTLTNWLPG